MILEYILHLPSGKYVPCLYINAWGRVQDDGSGDWQRFTAAKVDQALVA